VIFLSYLLGFSSIALAFYYQNVLFIFPFLSFVFYHLYRKRFVTTTLYILVSMFYLSHIYIQSLPTTSPPNVVFVTERRQTYMIVSGGIKRYYVRLSEQDPFEFGDLLQATFKIQPLKITTFESAFNFKTYLNTKGVYEELVMNDYRFIFNSPLQIQHKQNRFLSLFPEANQPYVSQLLFHQSDGLDTQGYYLVYVSGLGFFVLLTLIKKSVTRAKIRSNVLPYAIVFPYVLMHLYRMSIVRVFIFSFLDDALPKQYEKRTIKLAVLTILGLFLPHLFLQSGFQIYLLFQLYFTSFQNIINKRPFYIRPIVTIVMVSVIQLIFFGSINPVSIIFYLPVSYLNAGLGFMFYLPFLFEVYTPVFSMIITLYQIIIQVVIKVSFRLVIPSFNTSIFVILLFLLLTSILFYIFSFYKGLKMSSLSFLLISTFHLSGLNQFWLEPSIHFINVGQGDSTLIRHRRTNVLIDTGGQLSFDVASEVLIPYFKKLGIRMLNAVILTHGDFDHDGALPSLQNQFKIDQVIRDPFQRKIIGDIDLFQWNKTFTSEDENEKSLVITTQVGTCSVLLMGDASVAIEESILDDLPLSYYDILRTGHHGSLTSTSELFLDHIQPKTAIISVAESNRYGHPHPTVIKRLQERNIHIRRTDKDGTIVYKSCKL
jgi:competence protein ComEC